MKIVAIEPLGVAKELIDRLASVLKKQNHSFHYYETKVTDTKLLIERGKDADIIIVANLPLNEEVINDCMNLKMISVAFTGVEHIALQVCKRRNILVCNAAGYSTNAVAELAFGLMISLYRNIPECDIRTRSEGTKDGLVGPELKDKTLGIVGTGAIGLRVAEIARAFGCDLLGYSRTQRSEAEALGIKYVSLDELMSTCDIVTLHMPSDESTKNMISKDKIALMKRSALLINTARGPIVDNQALAEALKEGKIAGAGIDVFETEPPIPETHPLVDSPNTVLTPHVAFATKEAMIIRAEIVFNNISQWLKGEPVNIIKI